MTHHIQGNHTKYNRRIPKENNRGQNAVDRILI